MLRRILPSLARTGSVGEENDVREGEDTVKVRLRDQQ